MTPVPHKGRPPAPTARETAVLVAVLLAGASLLVVAAWLVPDPRGIGTHEQLGMPPCGFELATGLPCPTCGMTTSFAWMARLDVRRAWNAQPLGALLFFMVAAFTLASLYHLVAWRSPQRLLDRLPRRRILLLGTVATILAAWGWMIVRAEAP